MEWSALILSLPATNATARTRIWRGLKSLGAGTLRDGVYLLPVQAELQTALQAVEADAIAVGGNAQIVRLVSDGQQQQRSHIALFDRTESYRELGARVAEARVALKTDSEAAAMRTFRRLQKSFEVLCGIDFFAGPAQERPRKVLMQLQRAVTRQFSPDEPKMGEGQIEKLDASRFRGMVWATRRRPGIDRLASAWLIRRFIDPKSRFVWLAKTSAIPTRAIGFDFDGAPFTHRGDLVTFEMLVSSFGLDADGALGDLARIVHFLDVGGEGPAEAVGVGSLIDGLRALHQNDDKLLTAAMVAFDGLYQAFADGGAER